MFAFLHFGRKTEKITLNRREDIEPHEIFYDNLTKKRDKNENIGEKKIEAIISEKSLRLPLIMAAVFFIAAIARVGQLLAIESHGLNLAAERNKYLFYKVQSDRGIIYDSNLKPLVENLSAFDLQCVDSKMPSNNLERKKIIDSLAVILGVNPSVLNEAIASGKNPVAENLNHKALIVLEARMGDFGGCFVVERSIRDYARGHGLAHLLGYMGKIDSDEWKIASETYSINDYIGRAGLEKSYETVLRKNSGKMRLERDAKGNMISQEIAVNPQSGDSVQLWLDLDLQKKLHDSLAKQLKLLELKKAAAVVLDPKTGGILAMVSFPDYDNNVFSSASSTQMQALFNDQDNSLFNRTISGKYLTGSTIKPLEAAAVLQEKIISPEKNINCQGKLVVQNRYNPDIIYTFNDNHAHGITDMRKALAESCNVYFQTIAGGYGDQSGLGVTRLKKYLGLFGWQELTGVDLPGETAGFVPDPDWKKEKFFGTQDQNWGDGDTYNLAIGQGFIGITPLEVANAYAAIANGGILYRPQAVKNIINKNKEIIEEKKPQIIRQNFIDPQNLAVVREGMRHGVNGAGAPLASALTLNQLGIPMAAKTGTAQVRKAADGKDLVNAWTVVFAPYDDPQIVLVVMAEDVHEGTVAVLPVAKEVLGWYFEPKDVNGVRISEIATTTNAAPNTNNSDSNAESEPALIPEQEQNL